MQTNRNQALGLAALGVAFALAMASLAPPMKPRRPSPDPQQPVASRRTPATATSAESRRQARLHAQRELDRADAESRRAVERQLRELDAIFDAARRGLPRFADRVLGYEGQIALVTDWLTWSSRNHARAVDAAFRDCVVDPGQLERAAEGAVTGTLDALGAIDDALLVRLRRDLENLPAGAPIDMAGRDRYRHAVAASVRAATARSRPQLGRAVAVEVASIAASEVVAKLVLRAAATAGLIGASAASAPVSLGVGLAAGLAVDHAMSWAVDRWADPRGTLVGLLDARLAQLRRLVLEGSADEPGLRPRLEQLARDRSAARRTWILDALGATPKEVSP